MPVAHLPAVQDLLDADWSRTPRKIGSEFVLNESVDESVNILEETDAEFLGFFYYLK